MQWATIWWHGDEYYWSVFISSVSSHCKTVFTIDYCHSHHRLVPPLLQTIVTIITYSCHHSNRLLSLLSRANMNYSCVCTNAVYVKVSPGWEGGLLLKVNHKLRKLRRLVLIFRGAGSWEAVRCLSMGTSSWVFLWPHNLSSIPKHN